MSRALHAAPAGDRPRSRDTGVPLVAGMGAVTSVGRDVVSTFAGLCTGSSGLADLRGFDPSRYRAGRAYEIDDRQEAGSDVPGRATRWLVRAIEQALDAAGLHDNLRDVPVLVGTGLRELRSLELWWRDGTSFDVADLHFGTALRSRFSAATTYTFSNACSASLYALALASDLLTTGRAPAVVVAGVDTLTESMFGLLDRVHPVAPDAVRPFDRDRKGVLMGDGAAAVVLRPGPVGGPSCAALRAVALNCDAHHVTAPDPAGIQSAIRQAHARAGVEPGDIDLVLVHGTGTLLNDEAEASAMNAVFTQAGASPLVAAIKSMTGHTSGASGLLGVVIGATALAAGVVPPTVGLAHPVETAATLRFVTDHAFSADLSCVQVNAFGFGGLNAVAVLEGAV